MVSFGAVADVVEMPLDLSRDIRVAVTFGPAGISNWTLRPSALGRGIERDLTSRLRIERVGTSLRALIDDVTLAAYDVRTGKAVTERTHPLTSAELRSWPRMAGTFWTTWRRRIAQLVGSEPIHDLPLDLHTHYAGEAPSEDLLVVAENLGLDYPTTLLDALGIDLRGVKKFKDAEGVDVIHLGPGVLKTADRRKVLRALSVPPGEIGSFGMLERAYRYRDPIAKSKRAIIPTLRVIARHYADVGITYAELAISANLLTGPGTLAELTPELDRIEAATGVRLRFLASMQRTRDLDYMRTMSDKIIGAAASEAIAGVDFVGEETNSVADFSEIIAKFRTFKTAHRPHFQIRVHAGESPAFPDNVRLAVEAGATRIGHGLYGVDQATMALLARKRIVVEMNLGSNIALGYLAQANDALNLLNTYLSHGVPVVLSSDGSGIMSTDVASEVAEVARAGLPRASLDRLIGVQREYLSKIVRAKPSLHQARTHVVSDCNLELGGTK